MGLLVGNNLIKKCPICGNDIKYNSLDNLNKSIRNNNKCRSCSNRLRKVSNETRKKMSETRKKQIKSGEFKPNMSGAHSEKSRNKMSETKKRLKHTEEHKKNISKSLHHSEKFKIAMQSEDRKEKIRKANTGKVFTEEHKKKLSENHCDVSSNKNPFFGKTHSSEVKTLLRKLKLERIKRSKDNNYQITPFYNPKGCEYFNNLMIKEVCYIQHAENGGEYHIEELGYWVDGYDKENNIVYEWDEKHHFDKDGSYIKKDIIRENEIKEFLGCKFIRIKQ